MTLDAAIPVEPRTPDRTRRRALATPWTLVVTAVVLAGLFFRAWYVFHRPTNSDEAVAGLMVGQLLHGHANAFYWGQQYGGTAELFLVAPLFAVFGHSGITMLAVEVLLAAGAALLTWRIALRLAVGPRLAVAAGALVWCTSQAAVADTTFVYGFRGMTLVCGLAALLIALQVLDGRGGAARLSALGLVAGAGWWSSPEVAYLLLPAGMILVLATLELPSPGRTRPTVGRAWWLLVGFAVGALPWLWANARSGLASLRRSSFAVPPGSPGYAGRLRLVPRYVLPMQLSLREQFTGTWLGGHAAGVTLLLVLGVGIAIGVMRCLAARGRWAAIAAGLLIFPFLMSYSPSTWFWGDGRYASCAVALIALVVTAGFATPQEGRGRHGTRHGRRRPVRTGWLGVLAAGALIATSGWNFFTFVAPHPTLGWGRPDQPSSSTVRQLESAGVTDGYSSYWVAYRLDFLSGGRLHITVAGIDALRWPAVDRIVRASPDPAWLFLSPTAAAVDQFGVSSPVSGPATMSEDVFLAYLRRTGNSYRLVHAALIDAVIPEHAVSPALASPTLR